MAEQLNFHSFEQTSLKLNSASLPYLQHTNDYYNPSPPGLYVAFSQRTGNETGQEWV